MTHQGGGRIDISGLTTSDGGLVFAGPITQVHVTVDGVHRLQVTASNDGSHPIPDRGDVVGLLIAADSVRRLGA